jgi:hypothetical protein
MKQKKKMGDGQRDPKGHRQSQRKRKENQRPSSKKKIGSKMGRPEEENFVKKQVSLSIQRAYPSSQQGIQLESQTELTKVFLSRKLCIARFMSCSNAYPAKDNFSLHSHSLSTLST